MTLRVIGAGVGRTGTASLKAALEQLLGAPCYHMREVFGHPEHVAHWHAAARGEMPDWDALLEGYAAAVDWPPSAFWSELAAANPDAVIVLSLRSAESWWESANETIFRAIESVGNAPGGGLDGWSDMVRAMLANRFTSEIADREASIAAFERHNADVRARAPADRLVEWRAQDGWAPLCDALGLPVPDEPFPRTNTREQWRAQDAAASAD